MIIGFSDCKYLGIKDENIYVNNILRNKKLIRLKKYILNKYRIHGFTKLYLN